MGMGLRILPLGLIEAHGGGSPPITSPHTAGPRFYFTLPVADMGCVTPARRVFAFGLIPRL